MSLALIATHYADADKEEINVPYAIKNQPWLIKHIMAYNYLTYQKADKAKHKRKLNKLHEELSDYHWVNEHITRVYAPILRELNESLNRFVNESAPVKVYNN
tara:strand:- start:7 stop:312 length:306 start_codon:yes stop_codon:yes gene_type:complete